MSAGTLTWFARHECRLAWRDWLSMMTAGKRGRERTVAIVLVCFAAFMHFIAYATVAHYATIDRDPDKSTLIALTGSILLAFLLMISQAMESVTRAFYTRSDLDLILSSPAQARRLFAVRIATMALSVAAMGTLLASPFINVLAWLGGAHWLAAYGVVPAMGAAATALAVALTVALFRAIGPKRTRLAAQILAAVIGAAFVIGLQVAAIVSYGTLSRFALLQSAWLAADSPDPASILWSPARALLGDGPAFAAVLAASLLVLGGAILIFSARFGEHAIAAAGVTATATLHPRAAARFRRGSAQWVLRRKEWTLLRRDPWLVSQTLMQLLYLVPPAVLLWRGFADGSGAIVLLVPVLVRAAGQLAGGLAWLAISGEDAPDLVATAPVRPRFITRAKIEAVMAAMAIVFAPFLAALAFFSLFYAVVAAAFIAVAAAASTAIQLWFRSQAKRSHFRRRHTSSRMATFAEAFSSSIWAATAALTAFGTIVAVPTALVGIGLLAGVRYLSPRKARE